MAKVQNGAEVVLGDAWVGRPRLGAIRELCLRLVDSGIPSDLLVGDHETLRRARMILGITLALILLGIETAAFFTWVLEARAASVINLALAMGLSLTLLIPLALRRTGSLELGANLLIAGAFVVIVTTFTLLGGIRGPLLHWCGLLPMLAVLMGSRRSAWAWAGIGLTTIAAFAALDAAGWRFDNYMDLSSVPSSRLWAQRVVDVGSWLGILLGVTLLYEGYKVRQTAELAAKNAELELEVAQRGHAEERTHYLAYYDELTTLPNRRLFKQQLSQAMANADRRNRMVGVLYLDLDGFKQVNDTHGHAAGDDLLRQVARRFQNCIRLTDSVARGSGEDSQVVSRLGGDEFTLLLEEVRNHHEAAAIATRILACLEEPIALGDQEVFISASIGIALYPGEAEDIDELLRFSDIAMYQAKEDGRNNFQFFNAAMNAEIHRRSTIASELRHALDQQEFELHFQPIVDAGTRRINGLEALVRWHSPERGLVPPIEFIPIAEETGMIVRLGEWVIEQACAHYAKWQQAGIAPDRIAVNVSGLQFRRGQVVETMIESIREIGIQPECIELEITENAMMVDEEETSRCLAELKAFGFGIALDDFGTGFSSLSYVRRFPVDSLKIDRSFVSDIERDPEAQAIATAIIAMAHRLGLKVVGEGVETEPQERFLRENGCDELQGYRFSRPVPAEAMTQILADPSRLWEGLDD